MGNNITVVGIGADGWSGLDQRRRDAVTSADAILGSERHLNLLPAEGEARRIVLPSPLRENLPALLDSLLGDVAVLASGDPMLAGIGTTLVDLLGPERITVLPGVSSVALALARMRWPAEDVVVLRHHEKLLGHLREGQRSVVLSADETTPGALAATLTHAGFGASTLAVFSNLDGPDEDVLRGLAASWGDPSVARLNLVAVEVHGSGGTALPPVPGLPDDVYDHDGQLTKRDIRASALARLAPGPGLLWDVGAGAGSVAIEWSRQHPDAKAVAFEEDWTRAERIGRNAVALGVPDLEVVVGHAPDVLEDADEPDAVFIGGGATAPGLIATCWSALRPGGRIVVHGVTMETEQVLAEWYQRHGGEFTRLLVEHAAPIGRFTGWTPARAITQWMATKPNDVVRSGEAVPPVEDLGTIDEPDANGHDGSEPGTNQAGDDDGGLPDSDQYAVAGLAVPHDAASHGGRHAADYDEVAEYDEVEDDPVHDDPVLDDPVLDDPVLDEPAHDEMDESVAREPDPEPEELTPDEVGAADDVVIHDPEPSGFEPHVVDPDDAGPGVGEWDRPRFDQSGVDRPEFDGPGSDEVEPDAADVDQAASDGDGGDGEPPERNLRLVTRLEPALDPDLDLGDDPEERA